ncbi:hypothetical protein H6F43_14545 [Leptolyngbya sp. FACHB-36]|uniref:hypothetical protein n=1 Tax=Leptolyngbya sp. FACHB-36 TaxID=2692808 RepID=UPI00168087F5|nr:hypothetical protein [Leptolyngbya sp. FACHB-36]MBD2021396.1 hypothetical protein [Leptolyngbya sp. FACHB-36]
MAYWIKITYERNNYVIDLDRIPAFCQLPNGRISFALPDGSTTIVVNQQSDPDGYQLLVDYIEKQTGFSL